MFMQSAISRMLVGWFQIFLMAAMAILKLAEVLLRIVGTALADGILSPQPLAFVLVVGIYQQGQKREKWLKAPPVLQPSCMRLIRKLEATTLAAVFTQATLDIGGLIPVVFIYSTTAMPIVILQSNRALAPIMVSTPAASAPNSTPLLPLFYLLQSI